ncbi:glycoside hydrolase family 88 protein [Streptomyces sp. NBC_01186]|uniref:glycoside hydrolase family 88 protein n=1 Tax=unclassified Streptomyces TaxID=2593676 RepID=UPI002DDBCCD0|nr:MULTISPECIES: glycoside hydrolase family 88 protein [unclassified Streptomyces]WSB76292.1 glycoside hydrolase family 88 protein [Streptomyces sp. NBC_01775]WSS15433.1 glycoside hydrolase family 88 protein [Streptomyces sp. NBC_01186]
MNRRRLLLRAAALSAAATPSLLPPLLPSAQAAPARASRAKAGPPSRDEVTEAVTRAADHWISAHADPGNNQWARATFFSGLMALHRVTGQARHLAYARSWAEKHDYALHDGVSTRHADDHNAGQAYLDLYEAEGSRDEAKIAAIEESLHRMTFTDRPDKNDDWWWDDALHMAMPPFARIAVLRGEPAYADKLYRLYTHTKSAQGGPGLLDPGTGLWYRDDRFLPGGIASPGGKPVLWSRGNGWVAGGHVKTLKALAGGAAHTREYRTTLARLLAGVRAVQRDDGFWNVNLADPGHLPGPETSGTAFFTYATAYALRAGLVPPHYGDVVARAWRGLVTTALHPDGFLGYVQGVGDRPESSQPVTYETTSDFAVGAFLLAGAELLTR